MAHRPEAVSLRIKLRYGDLDEFVARYHENISSAGIFLRTRAPKPAGTQIRFELSLGDGSRVLRGEGVVVQTRTDDRAGMALRFNLLDAASQAVVEKVVATHGQGNLAPTPLTNAFSRESSQHEVTLDLRPHWRSQPRRRTGWSPSRKRPGDTTSTLPRRPRRTFSTTPSRSESAPPAEPSRLHSPVLRPWIRTADEPQGPERRERDPLPRSTKPSGAPLPRAPVLESETGQGSPASWSHSAETGTPTLVDATPPPSTDEPFDTDALVRKHETPRDPHTIEAHEQKDDIPTNPETFEALGREPDRPTDHAALERLEHESPHSTDRVTFEPLDFKSDDLPNESSGEVSSVALSRPPMVDFSEPNPIDFDNLPIPDFSDPRDTERGGTPATPPSDPAPEELGDPPSEDILVPPARDVAVRPPSDLFASAASSDVAFPSAKESEAPPADLDVPPARTIRASTTEEVVLSHPTDHVGSSETHDDRPTLPIRGDDPGDDPNRDAGPAEAPSGVAALQPEATRASFSTDMLAPFPAAADPPSGSAAGAQDAAETPIARSARPSDERALPGDAPEATSELEPPLTEHPEEQGKDEPDQPFFGTADVNAHWSEAQAEAPPFSAIPDGTASPEPVLHPPQEILSDPNILESNRLELEPSPAGEGSPTEEDSVDAYADTVDIAGRTISKPDDAAGLADTVDIPDRESKNDGYRAPTAAAPGTADVPARPGTGSTDTPPEPEDVLAARRSSRTQAHRTASPAGSTPHRRPQASVTVTGLSTAEAERLARAAPWGPRVASNPRTVVGQPGAGVGPSPDSEPENTATAEDEPTPPTTSRRSSPSTPSAVLGGAASREGRIVGIDLGGRWARVGLIEQGELELIAAEDSPFIPALVAVEPDGAIVAGKRALRIARAEPERAISVRNVLGSYHHEDAHSGVRNGDATEPPNVTLAGLTIPASKLVAPFFALIARSVARQLDSLSCRGVLGVPSTWEHEAVHAAIEACGQAGIEIVRAITEPDALVEAFNFRERSVEHVLMIDLGATHLSVMVARKNHDGFELLEWDWTADVSAASLDEAIANLAAEQLKEEIDPATILHLLREASELARLDIQRKPEVELKFNVPDPGNPTARWVERTLVLPRSAIYRATETVVTDICQRVQAVLQRAAVDTQVLDAVVAVGSGGHYPPFVAALTELTNRQPTAQHPATQICVVGLARRALVIEREDSAQADDALRASIGIELPGGRFGPLVRAGSTIPLRLERQFPTTRDNQSELELRFFQGDAEFVRSCRPLGRLVLTGFPRGLRAEVRIQLNLIIDAEGVLKVRLSEPQSGASEELTTATRQTPEDTADLLRNQLRHSPEGARKKPGLFRRLFGGK